MSIQSSSASAKPALTHRLLNRAHSPTTAAALYSEKIQHKPLLLTPASKSTSSDSTDARTRRQHVHKVRDEQSRRRKQKPRPLSAREKRALGVYDIPKEEKKYEIYEGLWKMWCAYIRDILNIQSPKMDDSAKQGTPVKPRTVYITPLAAGPNLTSADFHGAKITCVRSKCAGRVGTEGIVVRDTKFTFVVITKANEIKILPKEHSVFKFEVPLANEESTIPATEQTSTSNGEASQAGSLVFELYGEQFKNRAVDRATKKVKIHLPPDL